MMARAGHGLVVAYVLLLPISWSPFPANVQWSEIVFAILLLCLMMRGRGVIPWFHPLDALVVAYLVGGLVSVIGASDLARSLLQYAKHLYVGLVYCVFASIGAARAERARTLWWFTGGAGLLAGIALVAAAAHLLLGMPSSRLGPVTVIPYLGEVFRLRGTFLTPAYFANYLGFAFPLALVLSQIATSARARAGWWVAGAMIVLADLLTLTYSMVGVLAAGLSYLWTPLGMRGRRMLRAGLLVVTVAAVIVLNAMLIVVVREVRVERGDNAALGRPSYVYGLSVRDATSTLNVSVAYNLMSYYLFKAVAWETFWRKPWTGIGLGEFHEATELAYARGWIHERYRSVDPHSTWLGRLAETGLVGGITLVTLWGGVFFLAAPTGRGTGERRITLALLAGMVGLLVNSINTDIMNFRFLWVGLGLLRGELADESATSGES
jgi:O-antigen ligase